MEDRLEAQSEASDLERVVDLDAFVEHSNPLPVVARERGVVEGEQGRTLRQTKGCICPSTTTVNLLILITWYLCMISGECSFVVPYCDLSYRNFTSLAPASSAF